MRATQVSESKKPNSLRLRMGTVGQIFTMLGRTRRYWMAPMLVVLVLIGVALSALSAVPHVAPFIYAVF